MRRPSSLHLMTIAVCALSLLAPAAAHAAQLYDVGPGGYAGTAAHTLAAADVVAETTTQAATDTQATATMGTESHLPSWLQVTAARTSLYAGDTSNNQVLDSLARYTFLRVVSGGAARLQVQTYDANGTPGQSGWVDPTQVLPSAPGTNWGVTASATTLFNASDPSAQPVRNLDRFTPLLEMADPVQNRVPVSVYRADFSEMSDQGWVDLSVTGPALPPQMRVPAPSTAVGLRSRNSTASQQAFLDAAAQSARQNAVLTGVPASVTVAQAILESSWGQSELAVEANNYFGMKAMGALGNDGVVWMPTSEYDTDGELYQTMSAFRAYKSLADSMLDHDQLLSMASRYAGAMALRGDPKAFAAMIAVEGYSTDPAYASKLVALMDRYNLYQLDA